MRRLVKQKRGQFIVIAALMVAIMMVSIGAIMYGAVTYFRYERWEEYLAIIDNVKLGSSRVVEMSLASYTLTLDNETLKNNLDQWRSNITKAYPGFGLSLTYSDDTLAYYWYNQTSFSAANATFNLNITSVGLTGYEFTASAFLRMRILDYDVDNVLKIYLTVEREGLTPVTNLKKSNFQVNVTGYGSVDFSVARYYDVTYGFFLYEISCNSISGLPEDVTVTVVDTRGVKVVATSEEVVLRAPAVIGYRSGTGTYEEDSPKVRTWNGTVWLPESELPDAGSPVHFVRATYCPVAERYYEKIVVTLSEDGYLDAYVWNGTAWIVTNNISLTSTSPPSSRMFDVEYEKTSGEALLVYSNGYRIWNGSAWLDETPYNITTPPLDVNWIALAQNPTSGSDEIAIVALVNNTNVYGLIWNGSQLSDQPELLGVASSETTECIAVAYESISGYATFVWAGADLYSYSRQWNGSAWDASPTQINLNGGATLDVWLSLKADPVSDKLMLLDVDDALGLNTAYWNGSSWTVTPDHDTAVDTKASRCADLEWEPSGSRVLMVWGTKSKWLSYKTWTPSAGWSSESSISMGASTHPWVQLRRNSLRTDATKILGATLNSDEELGSLMWDGTTLTGTTGAFTIDTELISYECFEIEFQKFASPT